jgi:hypothetical protein
LFRGKGQSGEIGKAFDIIRLHARLVEGRSIMADGVINPLHHLLQPFELKRLQHFPGQGFKLLIVDHESSLPLLYS